MSALPGHFVPRVVPCVQTRYRRIVTELPPQDSLPLLEAMLRCEPRSMLGQPPIIWDRAEGFQVYDRYGNVWLDWSAGVLTANVGHSHPEVRRAILSTVEHGLLFSYVFPNIARIRLAERLLQLVPPGLDKVFLLTTGSEATENALKLALTYGQRRGGNRKSTMISFTNSFHGRTMGAQLMGGDPKLKQWIPIDEKFYQVPFPDGFRCPDTRFEVFLDSLRSSRITPNSVAGVIMESFLGGGASFAPPQYVQELRRWCTEHDVVLIFDEIQGGFGRSGKMFAFEHYGVVPDIVCCGKGISSSLPLSAVIAREHLLDQYGPGEMSSTHSGNPVAAHAALASIELLLREHIVENAESVGEILHDGLRRLRGEFESVIGAVHGKGLVGGVHIVRLGGTDPDGALAHAIVMECFYRGLLMFAPVGFGGATIKICPPLVIEADAVRDGLEVLREAFKTAVG
jgi:4-aminobutyrate aminotransferase / (S)-3-amino-2-methylpropionate transaminase / 5-aminovalerate transaminase